mmetsp:Transcript_28254/g.93567  ORF Transcript_28254/g.93567 Transcript_28254/m.93567 type:complete len:210 (-) Transcript_28254:957-1586(-)
MGNIHQSKWSAWISRHASLEARSRRASSVRRCSRLKSSNGDRFGFLCSPRVAGNHLGRTCASTRSAGDEFVRRIGDASVPRAERRRLPNSELDVDTLFRSPAARWRVGCSRGKSRSPSAASGGGREQKHDCWAPIGARPTPPPPATRLTCATSRMTRGPGIVRDCRRRHFRRRSRRQGGGLLRSGAPADPSSAATRYSKVTILSAIEPS